MKKTYIIPELHEQLVQPEGLIALSLNGAANDSEYLVKEDAGEWEDIWDE